MKNHQKISVVLFLIAGILGFDQAQAQDGREPRDIEAIPPSPPEVEEGHTKAAILEALRKKVDTLKQDAARENPRAQFDLAKFYEFGIIVPLSFSDAFNLYTKSAWNGEVRAQYALGRVYAIGQGVGIDMVKAYKWFNIAAAKSFCFASNGKLKTAAQERDKVGKILLERDTIDPIGTYSQVPSRLTQIVSPHGTILIRAQIISSRHLEDETRRLSRQLLLRKVKELQRQGKRKEALRLLQQSRKNS